MSTPFKGSIALQKAKEIGIKVGSEDVTPTFPFRDIIGEVYPKTAGVGAPTLDSFITQTRLFRYSVGDDGDIIFHVPHDYVPNTDMFFHVHWSHNGTNISGSFVITYNFCYAKRTLNNPAISFSPEKALTHTINSGIDITNTPQYAHRVDEIQITSAGGSASTIDKAIIEVDGLILLHFDVSTIPTITGGSGEPFIATLDIHYQSTGVGTKSKDPDYYV